MGPYTVSQLLKTIPVFKSWEHTGWLLIYARELVHLRIVFTIEQWRLPYVVRRSSPKTINLFLFCLASSTPLPVSSGRSLRQVAQAPVCTRAGQKACPVYGYNWHQARFHSSTSTSHECVDILTDLEYVSNRILLWAAFTYLGAGLVGVALLTPLGGKRTLMAAGIAVPFPTSTPCDASKANA